jgi:hypothetical protein
MPSEMVYIEPHENWPNWMTSEPTATKCLTAVLTSITYWATAHGREIEKKSFQPDD